MTEIFDQESQKPKTSLELLYRVSREIATALDLATVLERVLHLSMDTVGAISGSIIILDDQEVPVESAIIVQDQVIYHTNDQLKTTLEFGLAGWIVENRQAVNISNTSEDDRWLRRPDDQETATGSKSVVAVPILARDKLVGVITLVHPEPNHLNEEHLELVQAIADQASVAVLNARLYEESQRQARVMTALANSAKAISSTIRLDNVLHNILKQIKTALEVEMVALSLMNDQDQLVYRAAIHSSLDIRKKIIGETLKAGKGVAGWVAKTGQGITINQVENDPRIKDSKLLYEPVQVKAVAAAPIYLHGKVIGVLESINPEDGSFESDAMVVLSGIGSLAGSSIQNAQLFEDLQAAHNRYHDLFENSADPILITDLNGNIVETNYRTLKVSQYTPYDLELMNIEQIHQVNWEQVGSDFKLLMEHGFLTYESTLTTKPGEQIPIHVNVHPIKIEDQQRIEWILRDISERKKLDQLRDDLTSMIYHDLRSPLSNVISSLDVIQATLPEQKDDELESLFDIATRSTQRIQRLTKSLLDINRLESGQPITSKEPCQPALLIQNAQLALISSSNAKNQQVKIALPEQLPKLMADQDMLERVLINLLQNAIKFSPPEAEIEIGAKKENTSIHFWVQDSGPGVDPDSKDRIFDKFTRIHPDERIKGLGLGLAFCRLAVEGHGGKIWVENLPKAGAKFSFTLPVLPES
jgi:PAS domain S-box-containing protein